jgi:choline-sulfatase
MSNAGDKYINTPNLDNLARNGVKFSNAYTNCPLCVPARMALLSGRLPLQNRCLTNEGILPENIPTYAHSMNIGGYETVLSGRMHILGTDQYKGNEKRLTGDTTSLYMGYKKAIKNLGDKFIGSNLQKIECVDKSGGGNCVVQEYDNSVVENTIRYLENRNDERPLMMTVGFYAPHPPFIADVERYKYYYNLLDDAYCSEVFKETLHPALKEWKRRRQVENVANRDLRRMRAAYYANVEFMDNNLGRIIDKAKEVLGENTIFIYASDHGESMGINTMLWKTTFFDSSVKIPMIFSGPDIDKYKVVEEPVCLNDITRTLVDYGGGPELPKAYGMSLRAVLENKGKIDKDRAIISQIGTYGKNKDDVDLPSAMIKKGRYKLISYHGYDRVSLYDTSSDYNCVHDLGLDPEFDEIKKALLEELNEHWDGQEAEDISKENLDNFNIMKAWTNITEFPLIEKFYDGYEGKIIPNWSMNKEDNFLIAGNLEENEEINISYKLFSNSLSK